MNRISMGQQARLPDLPRLPLVGSDMNRQRASAEGRARQVGRDALLDQMMQKKKERTVPGGGERNAAAAQAAFLTGKVRNRLGTGPNQDLRSLQKSIHTIGQAIG